MAKKSKIVEIKAQTEPQRGVGPDADPSDPVLILYPRGASEEIIGSLAGGEEDEAIIKTAGCIVPGDITIRYSEPASGGFNYVPFSFTSTADPTHYGIYSTNMLGVPVFLDNNNNMYLDPDNFHSASGFIPLFDNNNYVISFAIGSNSDILTVKVNGNDVSYDSKGELYHVLIVSPTYPETLNILVADKT